MKSTYFLFLFVFFSFSSFSMDGCIEKERLDAPVQNTFTSDNGKKLRKAKRIRKKRRRRSARCRRKSYAG